MASIALMVYLYFKQKIAFLFSIIFIRTPIQSIIEGIFLMKNAKNFYYPEIATFPWNNLSEYWPYSYDLSLLLSLFLFIIIFSCMFYFFRRFKAQNQLHEGLY
jgi:hypothetical protein